MAIKSTCCSSRGPRFQFPHDNSQSPATPVLQLQFQGIQCPLLTLWDPGTDIHAGNTVELLRCIHAGVCSRAGGVGGGEREREERETERGRRREKGKERREEETEH